MEIYERKINFDDVFSVVKRFLFFAHGRGYFFSIHTNIPQGFRISPEKSSRDCLSRDEENILLQNDGFIASCTGFYCDSTGCHKRKLKALSE
jgi:hypothetical protein